MVEYKIDLCKVIDGLRPELRQQLAHSLALQPDVIEYVVQQILDGYTDFGSCSGRDQNATSHPTGLDRAIRKIAENASGIAAEEIQRLNESLRRWEDWALRLESQRRRQFMFLLTYRGESRIVRSRSESHARAIVTRRLNWPDDSQMVDCRYLVTEGPPGILIEKEPLDVRLSDN